MKALVIYGTRRGGTENIAERIGQVLKRQGHDVDVTNAKKILKHLFHMTSSLLEAELELTNGPKKPSTF